MPQEKPIERPKATELARAAVREMGQCTFARGDDGSFVLSNGLVRLSGRIGGEGVLLDGIGVFSPSIREYSRGGMEWSGAEEVVDVRD